MPLVADAAGRHRHVLLDMDSGCAACAAEVDVLEGLAAWLEYERAVRRPRVTTIPIAEVLEYVQRTIADRRQRRY